MPRDVKIQTEALSTTYDYEAYDLGTIRYESPAEVKAANSTHLGERYWIFIKAAEAITANVLVSMDNTTPVAFNGEIAATAAQVADYVLGVAPHAIASGYYGWIICKGYCEALSSDGGIAMGEALCSHTSGHVDTMAAGEEHCVIGWATEADAATGEAFTIVIRTPWA